MTREKIFAAYATLLMLAGTPALAEEQTTQRTTQQHGVQVDAQTGTVTQQQNTHQDTKKEQSNAAGAKVEKEHSVSGSTTTRTADGQKHETNAADKSKASVTAHADGDVSVEQKTQHEESHKTN